MRKRAREARGQEASSECESLDDDADVDRNADAFVFVHF